MCWGLSGRPLPRKRGVGLEAGSGVKRMLAPHLQLQAAAAGGSRGLSFLLRAGYLPVHTWGSTGLSWEVCKEGL